MERILIKPDTEFNSVTVQPLQLPPPPPPSPLSLVIIGTEKRAETVLVDEVQGIKFCIRWLLNAAGNTRAHTRAAFLGPINCKAVFNLLERKREAENNPFACRKRSGCTT